MVWTCTIQCSTAGFTPIPPQPAQLVTRCNDLMKIYHLSATFSTTNIIKWTSFPSLSYLSIPCGKVILGLCTKCLNYMIWYIWTVWEYQQNYIIIISLRYLVSCDNLTSLLALIFQLSITDSLSSHEKALRCCLIVVFFPRYTCIQYQLKLEFFFWIFFTF